MSLFFTKIQTFEQVWFSRTHKMKCVPEKEKL
jgi:hypothetical protein